MELLPKFYFATYLVFKGNFLLQLLRNIKKKKSYKKVRTAKSNFTDNFPCAGKFALPLFCFKLLSAALHLVHIFLRFFSEECFSAKTITSSLVFMKKGYFLFYFLCSQNGNVGGFCMLKIPIFTFI